ncbi:MAG: hypothetical protein ACOYLB_16720 [Phototrophicaceae bacterium]
MTTLTSASSSMRTRHSQRVASMPILDWLVAIAGLLFVSGIYFDGWAHTHGRVDESFFTVYHAVLYSGYLLAGAIFVIAQFVNVRRGYSFSNALPKGYMLGLVGVFLFGVAGVGDLIWHTLFGIEEGIEALLSPTHMLLGASGFLIASTPLRAAWQSDQQTRGVSFLPILMGVLAMIGIMTFFSQYSYYTINLGLLNGTRPASLVYLTDISGLMGFLIPTVVVCGMVYYLLHRWSLPIGSVTFLFALNGLMMSLMSLNLSRQDLITALTTYSLGFLACGIVGDILLAILKPSPQRPTQYRLFATTLPAVLLLGMLLTVNFTGQQIGEGALWWEIHMWAGVPCLGAFVGYFFSHLMLPPSAQPA